MRRAKRDKVDQMQHIHNVREYDWAGSIGKSNGASHPYIYILVPDPPVRQAPAPALTIRIV